MSKTTEALELAEESLGNLIVWMDANKLVVLPKERKNLAAIREALAETVKPQKERQDFIDGYTAGMADAKRIQANAEPEKQEPVAWMYTSKHHGNKTLEWNRVDGDISDCIETPLYAAPVSAPKQEPVAVVDEIGKRLDGTYIFNAVGKVDVGQPLYAAPVDAKAIRAEALKEVAKLCDRHAAAELIGSDAHCALKELAAAIAAFKEKNK